MKGKAAISFQPGEPLEIREYPVPDVGPDDILVKVNLANICGSDLHMWRGGGAKFQRGIAQILGHEMMGTVYALGENVKTDNLGRPLQVGDRIVYSYFRHCGKCWTCLRGEPGCPNRYRDWLGVPADQPPHFNGAYAEYYFMPPGHWVFKVPDELPDKVVSPVNCALAEVYYGLHHLNVSPGETVVIQGVGGLGLYATAIARERGAAQVIVLDKIQERLDLAREFGADHTLNVNETDAEERLARVQEWTAGWGANAAVELTGSPHVLQEGLAMLGRGGRYLLIGNITPGRMTEVDPGHMVREGKTMTGVVSYEAWVLPQALDFLKRRRDTYPFDRIISHTFKLEDINEAFAFAAAGKAIRVGIEC